MCYFFSCIVVSPYLAKMYGMGPVLFTEKDSHNDILQRLQIEDRRLYERSFVRIECANGILTRFKEDETKTLPRWYDHERAYNQVGDVLDKVLAEREQKRDERNKLYQAREETSERFRQSMMLALDEAQRMKLFEEREIALNNFWDQIQAVNNTLYRSIRGYVPANYVLPETSG